MSEQKKIYTAQELREAADLREAWGDKDEVNKMLYYAADMRERCEAEIAKLPYPPNADDVYMFKRLNYILRGDAGEEEK